MSDVLELVSSTLLDDDAFNAELESWCAKHCQVFDTETEEHKFEYSSLHEKFCKLFEDKVTAVLTGTGHSGKECRHATEHICFNILHLLSVSTWNLSS